MRIRCKSEPYVPPPKDGKLHVRPLLPTLQDCEITDDAGNPMRGVTSVRIEIRPNEPIVAHVTHVVTELDVEAIEADAKLDALMTPEQKQRGLALAALSMGIRAGCWKCGDTGVLVASHGTPRTRFCDCALGRRMSEREPIKPRWTEPTDIPAFVTRPKASPITDTVEAFIQEHGRPARMRMHPKTWDRLVADWSEYVFSPTEPPYAEPAGWFKAIPVYADDQLPEGTVTE